MLKRSITRILTIVRRSRLSLLVPGLVVGLSSCINENEPINNSDDEDSKYEITFTINVGKSRGADNTSDLDYYYKDEDGNSYSDGVGYENYIDPAKLHVLLYNGYTSGNNFGGSGLNKELTISDVTKLSNTEYRVRIDGSKDDLPDKFIIVVTANWQYTPDERAAKGYDYKSNIAYLCVQRGAEYSYHYGINSPCSSTPIGQSDTGTNGYCNYADADGNPTYFVPSEETPIPMFGLKTYAKSASWGNKVELGTIYLIRAMAKLVVKSSNDSYKLNSATLSHYYDVGYCGFAQPMESTTKSKGVSIYDADNGSTDPDYYNYNNYVIMEELGVPGDFTGNFKKGFNDENPTHRCTNLPFKAYTNSDGKTIYVAYIPAYNNKLTHSNLPALEGHLTVNITANGKTEDYEILFKDQDGGSYDDNSLYDLWRNHMYIYDITTIAAKKTLNYVVTELDDYNAPLITFE
jgi:hypothetical protein